MEIRCKAWNPSKQKTMGHNRWLIPKAYNEPLNAADHAIDSVIAALRTEGCNPDVTTAITLSLNEYRLLISDAQKKAKEECCKEGREEAWDLARRIAAFGEDTYTWAELDSVFGSQCDNTIFEMPVNEALAKDKEYREGKNTLRIGDEVEFGVLRGYIIENLLSGEVRVLTKIYGTFTVSCKECKKTGKHSEEIERAMASF